MNWLYHFSSIAPILAQLVVEIDVLMITYLSIYYYCQSECSGFRTKRPGWLPWLWSFITSVLLMIRLLSLKMTLIYLRSFLIILPLSAPQNSFPSPSQSVFPPTDQTPAAVSPKITAKDSNYTDPIRLQSNQPRRTDSFDDVSINKKLIYYINLCISFTKYIFVRTNSVEM